MSLVSFVCWIEPFVCRSSFAVVRSFGRSVAATVTHEMRVGRGVDKHLYPEYI